jgi:hypothetical protein
MNRNGEPDVDGSRSCVARTPIGHAGGRWVTRIRAHRYGNPYANRPPSAARSLSVPSVKNQMPGSPLGGKHSRSRFYLTAKRAIPFPHAGDGKRSPSIYLRPVPEKRPIGLAASAGGCSLREEVDFCHCHCPNRNLEGVNMKLTAPRAARQPKCGGC